MPQAQQKEEDGAGADRVPGALKITEDLRRRNASARERLGALREKAAEGKKKRGHRPKTYKYSVEEQPDPCFIGPAVDLGPEPAPTCPEMVANALSALFGALKPSAD